MSFLRLLRYYRIEWGYPDQDGKFRFARSVSFGQVFKYGGTEHRLAATSPYRLCRPVEIHKEKVYLLSLAPYRSADLVVTLLSRMFGRLAALVHEGKRIGKKSSFPYHQGDCLEIEFQIRERNEFVKIHSVQAAKRIDPATLPYDRFLFHCYFLEVVRLISRPKTPEEELTDVTRFYLEQSWRQQTKYSLMAAILWRIIGIGGYRFHFNACSTCRRETLRVDKENTVAVRKQSYQLNLDAGEVVCSTCLPSPEDALLTSAMLKALWLMDAPPSTEMVTSAIPDSVTKPLIRLLNQYMLHCLEIRPKSSAMFLSSI